MRIRNAAAAAMLGTVVAVGALTVPAQATPVKAPVTTAATWMSVGRFFFRSDCEVARIDFTYDYIPSRCVFNGVFRYYDLQVFI